ncbi:MAG: hypothetical protein COX62_04680 [Deltaproteobacteria bacterium CG_4_10_14_0_2_um_filter_43_8]|nr:MAG: hypothetical protein COV43_03795 [Deltaproteobacteria bacterium CG11_big_fil_rev_8_21_14_0_20_42_23]PJA20485.1 MAG: hypothetical protein COX62_04680 [Deltaproteobacteria bacterium CG_4_10_14_0_2_um_filter_43_8]PJC63359.1 MAG: hypothetical protein CO021_09765 [Deltaproteobacteria bacterium CG_4_9_14_0_2_um_filter_42_21]
MKLNKKKQEVIADFLVKNEGVFSTSELQTLLQVGSKLQFYREVSKLEKEGILTSFIRGIFVSQNPNLEVLSQRLQAKSYLSLGTALSKHMLIGSVPAKTVYAIKIGKKRKYQSTYGEIIHLGISPHLFFGFEVSNGIWMANKEKAFLDTLYYHLKGQRYSFDIFSDIALEKLNLKIIDRYLKKYKNKKFVSFVRSFFHD